MKNVIYTLITCSLVSVSAFADNKKPNVEPGPVQQITEGKEIVRALILNPKIVKELKEKNVFEVLNMTKQGLAPGITEYQLQVTACGMCLPRTSIVTILEDVRPTYSDGAIKYDIKIDTAE